MNKQYSNLPWKLQSITTIFIEACILIPWFESILKDSPLSRIIESNCSLECLFIQQQSKKFRKISEKYGFNCTTEVMHTYILYGILYTSNTIRDFHLVILAPITCSLQLFTYLIFSWIEMNGAFNVNQMKAWRPFQRNKSTKLRRIELHLSICNAQCANWCKCFLDDSSFQALNYSFFAH